MYKIGKNVPINLQEGDLVELFSSRWLNEYGEPKEESIFNLNLVRDGQSMTIPYTVQTINVQNEKNRVFTKEKPSQEQIRLQDLWLNN